MRQYLVLAAVVALYPAVLWSQEKSTDADENEPPARVDLLRFYDTKLNEHIYTYGDGEPQAWRERDGVESETIVGKVALTKEKGTTPLFRAVRKDGRHYFFLIKPTAATEYKLEDFHVFVWTKPGDGRIPVHACVQPDALDLCLDTDLKKINDFTVGSLKGTGIKRKIFSRMFFVYPADADENPKVEEKPKSAEKPKVESKKSGKK